MLFDFLIPLLAVSKPTLAKSFLWALCLPLFWVAILFVFTLQNHRSHIHNQLQREALDLTSLRFTTAAFNKLEWKHNKEFKWNNVMYDVVRIQKLANGYEVLAYEDQIETEIIRYCKKGIKSMFGNGENKEEQGQLLGLWFKSLFLPPKPHLPFAVNQIDKLQVHPCGNLMLSGNYFCKPFHPPCIPVLFC